VLYIFNYSKKKTLVNCLFPLYDYFMGANAKYKDSVFSFLFSDPDVLRELYSALEGIALPPDMPISVNTLSDVLYMDRINDISFTVDNRLVVLIEHQSTVNPNMPLRLLIYIARIYEKTASRKKLYQTALEKIPVPEFIVLYNGAGPYPDQKELRLSEAFKDAAGLKGAALAGPALELVVRVYNINKGHNAELAQKSSTLGGYSAFVGKVRENRESMPLEEAIRAAIKYCMEHDILKTFLETNSSEVFNMLLSEWNIEDAKVAWQEESREEERLIIARNALAKGSSIEFIREITGLDIDTIESLN